MTDQIKLALTFLLGVISGADLFCKKLTRSGLFFFLNNIQSGCDLVVIEKIDSKSRALGYLDTLYALGLVQGTLLRSTETERKWVYTITPEGRRFKADFFGAEYGSYCEVADHPVGLRARARKAA